MMMFTNASCTLFRKGIDAAARLPTWESVPIEAVYWEGETAQKLDNKSLSEDDAVFIVIPKAFLPDVLPKRDDRIAYGAAESCEGAYTILRVASFLYGSEDVQHIEITAV